MTALSFVWVYPYSQNSRCDNHIHPKLLHDWEAHRLSVNIDGIMAWVMYGFLK